MRFDKLNKDLESNKFNLFLGDKDALFKKAMGIFSYVTIENPELGKYRNSKLPTIDVMKTLENMGLLNDTKDFYKKTFSSLSKEWDPVIAGEEFERLMRVVLMEAENIS